MTPVEGNIYSVEVPVAAEKIIFNDGIDKQTPDLSIPTDGKNLCIFGTDVWSVYGGGSSDQDTSITVNGTYVPGGTGAEKISVNIVWDAPVPPKAGKPEVSLAAKLPLA